MAATSTEAVEDKEAKAKKIVRNYMIGAVAAGAIPAPAFDLAIVTGIQLKMLHSISKTYDTPFMENIGKSTIASLVGGLGAKTLARGTFGSLVKMIPVVGHVAGALTLPSMAAAATYAIGKVFIKHYEAGGTLLNFDPQKMKDYFADSYGEGKKESADIKK